MFEKSEMNVLVGKTIVRIELDETKRAMRFTDSEEKFYVFDFESDCCSETWVEHVCFSGFPSFPLKVIEAKDISLGEAMPTFQDVDQLYGIELKTLDSMEDTTAINIEFRNTSNGYYGGSCEFRKGDIGEEEIWKEVPRRGI